MSFIKKAAGKIKGLKKKKTEEEEKAEYIRSQRKYDEDKRKRALEEREKELAKEKEIEIESGKTTHKITKEKTFADIEEPTEEEPEIKEPVIDESKVMTPQENEEKEKKEGTITKIKKFKLPKLTEEQKKKLGEDLKKFKQGARSARDKYEKFATDFQKYEKGVNTAGEQLFSTQAQIAKRLAIDEELTTRDVPSAAPVRARTSGKKVASYNTDEVDFGAYLKQNFALPTGGGGSEKEDFSSIRGYLDNFDISKRPQRTSEQDDYSGYLNQFIPGVPAPVRPRQTQPERIVQKGKKGKSVTHVTIVREEPEQKDDLSGFIPGSDMALDYSGYLENFEMLGTGRVKKQTQQSKEKKQKIQQRQKMWFEL